MSYTKLTAEAEAYLRKYYRKKPLTHFADKFGVNPRTVAVWAMRMRLKSELGLDAEKPKPPIRPKPKKIYRILKEAKK